MMRILTMLVLFYCVFSVVDGKRKKKGKPKLPPIPAGSMRITANITLKCATYKSYNITIQMKETDHLSSDEFIGEPWRFEIKKHKAQTVFIWGDTAEGDGWFDNTLEIFYKVEHNCTPERTIAKIDVPGKGEFVPPGISPVIPFDVDFKENTTYQLPSGPPDFKVWNLEQLLFQQD